MVIVVGNSSNVLQGFRLSVKNIHLFSVRMLNENRCIKSRYYFIILLSISYSNENKTARKYKSYNNNRCSYCNINVNRYLLCIISILYQVNNNCNRIV